MAYAGDLKSSALKACGFDSHPGHRVKFSTGFIHSIFLEMFSNTENLISASISIKNKKASNKKAFTLIELLVVIAVIGLLASIVLVNVRGVRAKARDARRLSDMKQIVLALQLYLDSTGAYPGNTDNDCSGWDAGYNGGPTSGDPFIQPLVTAGLLSKTPGDPTATGACGGYAYYRYSAGDYGCDPSRGAYFVLGIRDMETSGNPHPNSPGWSCPSRNWQGEFDWVIGGFEK